MGSEGNEAARVLGAALRSERLACGMSLRKLARQIGLSGHGTLVDYEYGRRIPPADLLAACERALGVPDGQLGKLRRAALAERGHAEAGALLLYARTTTQPTPRAPTPVAVVTRRRRYRMRILLAVVLPVVTAAVLTAVAVVAQWPAGGRIWPPAHVGTVRMGFERPQDAWAILWGHQAARAGVTDRLAYEGRHSFETVVTGASSAVGYVGVGTTHGLVTLHPGMTVTLRIWTTNPTDGVRFFAKSGPTSPVIWAPETRDTETPIPGTAGWAELRFTVPSVSPLYAIGLQLYSGSNDPLAVAIDAVSW